MASRSEECFRILVLGKVGMGKSSTANKLLQIPGLNASWEDSAAHNHQIPPKKFQTDDTQSGQELDSRKFANQQPLTGPSSEESELESIRDLNHDGTRADTVGKIVDMGTSLRTDPQCEKSYFEVNDTIDADSCTKYPKCLKNTATNVCVLDTPGLGGFDDYAKESSLTCSQINFAMFRKIVKFQKVYEAEPMPFDCILYFLPVRYSLEKCDAYVLKELQLMVRLFGSRIIESIIVVITCHPLDDKPLLPTLIQEAKKNFSLCLKNIDIQVKSLPEIIFIAKNANGSDVLKEVRKISMTLERIVLKFEKNSCTKCACQLYDRNGETISSDTCHPAFEPKYSKVEKIVGSLTQVASGGLIKFVEYVKNINYIPTLWSEDEVCVYCKNPPGSKGCWRLRTDYTQYHDNQVTVHLMVDHSNEVF